MKCFFCHDFENWEKDDEGNLSSDKKVVGYWIRQRRQCKRCKYIEIDFQERFV